jgi:hypothetical protein
MIFIEITNTKEIVRRERGWLSAKVGPYVTDLEGRVEKEIVGEILASFEARGVKATVSSASGINMSSIQVEGLVQHALVEEQGVDVDTPES